MRTCRERDRTAHAHYFVLQQQVASVAKEEPVEL